MVTGKAADQLGRRRMFMGGLVIFGAGSALAAVAPGIGLLVVGRAIQGIGGAMLTPASLGLLLAAFLFSTGFYIARRTGPKAHDHAYEPIRGMEL